MNKESFHIDITNTNHVPTLTDNVALITGAASGYGAAMATALLQAGATVILADKNVPLLEKLYDDTEHLSGEAILFPINLESATHDDHLQLASTIDAQFEKLDIIIHNASLCGPLSPIEHFDIKQWFTQIQVNLNVPFVMHKTLSPLLTKSVQAREIFIFDDIDREHEAYWGGYSVSKKGLLELMRMLADELDSQPNRLVYGIDPGTFDSPTRRKLFPAKDPNQWLKPEDLSYLLSESFQLDRESLSAKVLIPARD